MYEEGDDGDNEFTNDNDFSQDEENITELADDEEEEKTEAEKNAFKLSTFKNVLENIDKKSKKTIPIMTKFEKARIKGVQLKQIIFQKKVKKKVCYGYNDETGSWHCTMCGLDMGIYNPRQLCGKIYCYNYDS